MAGRTTNPHDAEEALRPVLGQLHEADAKVSRHGLHADAAELVEDLAEQQRLTRVALDQALELLGVPQ